MTVSLVLIAVVWQQMRAYTLALLSKLTEDGKKIEDKDIVDWVNEKVSEKDGTLRPCVVL